MSTARLAFAAVVVAVFSAIPGVAAGAPLQGAIARPDAQDAVRVYLGEHRQELGLTGADIADVTVSDSYTDAHNGVTYVYVQQRYKGIDVFDAILNMGIAQDGSTVHVGDRFVPNLAAAVDDHNPQRTARGGLADVLRHLGLVPDRVPEVRSVKGGPGRETVFEETGLSSQTIRARLVYEPMAEQDVRLAWEVEIAPAGTDDWWNIRVDAATGALLGQLNYTSDASYDVFALPKESPAIGSRTVEVDPQDAVASPLGWHDTNGVSGPEFTITRGNNVHAYTDLDANNVADAGSEPNGGAGLVFALPLDLSQPPSTYRPFAVSNLFYWCNLVHDVFYGYGFTEAAGNFQVNNYGRGGVGNDDVRCEAQDGSGLNNANFSTPADGNRPRMQMFVWRGPVNFHVDSPAVIAGGREATSAGFGPVFPAAGLTSEVVLALDEENAAGPTATDACTALTNAAAVAGNIALVDRGSCNFSVKVYNAQLAGAVAVIVANNVPGAPISMGAGTNAELVTIPSTMVSLDDGNAIKANLAAPVVVTIAAAGVDRDSDLDSGVIAHEYGHGISNRLTGGPSTTACLGNQEQMGEGWSDFIALVMTALPTDTATTSRGMGTYVNFQARPEQGIRPTQYTTDMSVNPSTYGTVIANAGGTLTIPHGVGYVWASMLWDVYWNLVGAHGFNPDIRGAWSTGGNNLAVQLVIDGMKLQACRPGFVDGRDAILGADRALTGGQNQCAIWRAFARRGLGWSADQGSNNSANDGSEAFDLPLFCQFGGLIGPAADPPALNTSNAGATVPILFSLGGDHGLGIFTSSYPQSNQIDCDTKAATGSSTPTQTPGGASLSYAPATDRYTYPWKTVRGWSGTCRQLTLRFSDGTERIAYFSFR